LFAEVKSELLKSVANGSEPRWPLEIGYINSYRRVMPESRTISQLEAEGYPWIGCECCKGTVWVPFKMLREHIPTLSAMTLDELGARMKWRSLRKPAASVLSGSAGRRSGVRQNVLVKAYRASARSTRLRMLPSFFTAFLTADFALPLFLDA
jgi:hypothetical protein